MGRRRRRRWMHKLVFLVGFFGIWISASVIFLRDEPRLQRGTRAAQESSFHNRYCVEQPIEVLDFICKLHNH